MLRLPDGMRDRLKASAEENNRTLNAEVVARIEASYQAPRDRIAARAREIELGVSEVAARGEMLDLRAELLHSRLDRLQSRIEQAPTAALAAELTQQANELRAELAKVQHARAQFAEQSADLVDRMARIRAMVERSPEE
ncbi:hypothetical protein A9977_13570 [Variovorax sp. UMC13]|nr:hypothetical protein [Variovorax sp. UMC13]